MLLQLSGPLKTDALRSLLAAATTIDDLEAIVRQTLLAPPMFGTPRVRARSGHGQGQCDQPQVHAAESTAAVPSEATVADACLGDDSLCDCAVDAVVSLEQQ